jgi:hypothetical protein
MKILFGAIFFLFIAITTQAQSYDGKGDSKINVGYNIYDYQNGSGIKATYSYGLSDQFSLGAGATYYFNNEDNDYFLYVRASFHLGPLMDLPPKLDIYPGVEIGYLSSQNIGLGAYLGIRYFFNDRIGIYTEIGSYGAIGLSVCI